MLVNPSVQQPSFTAQPTPAQSEVGREDVVRSDLPPVEQTSDSSAAQNQQLQSETQRFEQDFQQQQTVDESVAQGVDESLARADDNRRAEENSQQQRLQQDRANDERVAEEQRVQDEAIISQLKARDREVRVHEAAHAAVGGRYAGSPSLQYERGPDGVNYAVSGEVSINVSKASDPEVTLEKARVIRAAALAPAEPSAQDRRVAAEASQLETEARTEIQQQKIESEQERRDRIERARDEELKEEAVNDEFESSEEVEVETTEVTVATTPQVGGESKSTDSGDEDSSEQKSEESKTTAKDQLEEILLSSQSVPKSLNQAGLVDTQNPYGKSGFIEFIV